MCYQTLENVENYLYRRFSNETNRALAYSESDSSAHLSVSQKLLVRKPYTQSCFTMGQFKVLAIKLLGGERERSSTYGIAELGGRKKILEKRKAIPVAVEIENL